MITGKAKLAGIMGWPVSHSRSPLLHNYWLHHYGIDGAYVPLAVAPKNLEQALRTLPMLGFRGVNLTLPHKEAALHCVDHLDPVASRIGAVNTVIVRDDGSLEGRNTDAFGFSENLKAAGYVPNNHRVVVLGAGGAARAVIVALQDMGFTEIRLMNRTYDRAEKLAHEFGTTIKPLHWEERNDAMTNAGLLVNTTSLGMQGQPPLELDLSALPTDAWVTDIVYTPLVTGLVQQAQTRGHKTVDGLGMLLHQARPSFKAWFGIEPEVTKELRTMML